MIMPILSVKDVDASVAFYVQKLKFEHMMSMPGPDGKSAFAIVNLGRGASLGLSLSSEPVNVGKAVQFMLYVPDETDLDNYYAEVKATGVKLDEEIGDRYWGDRTFTLFDPDGYWLNLAKTVKQMSLDEIAQAAQSAN